ncbi:MAG: DNA repair protein RecN, partial [Chlamydiae bacterium]|nr:DNA repair protein RecN [Chlamydiota bacterium]
MLRDMLIALTLKNFVLIDHATIPFDTGFHVLTGETGAGKTLLVQAIHLLTGQKAAIDSIRSGEERAVLEATFDIEKLPSAQQILSEAGIEFDPEEYLIIKREVMRSAKNRIFINSQMASLSLLSRLGPALLSLTGQSTSQSLRKGEEQRALVDTFGSLQSDLSAFSIAYHEEKKLREELSRLMGVTAELKLEKLKREVEEWRALRYQEGEEETLFDEYKELAHSQERLETLRAIEERLNRPSLLPELIECQKLSDSLSQDELSGHLRSALINLQEASYLSSQTVEKIAHQPLRFEELEKRLTALNSLKKKYHVENSEIPARLKELEAEIDELENLDLRILSLQKRVSEKNEENRASADRLSMKRSDSAKLLSSRLAQELRELNIPYAEVEIRITPKEMGPTGADEVSIYLAANKGESPASLQSKSSGG